MQVHHLGDTVHPWHSTWSSTPRKKEIAASLSPHATTLRYGMPAFPTPPVEHHSSRVSVLAGGTYASGTIARRTCPRSLLTAAQLGAPRPLRLAIFFWTVRAIIRRGACPDSSTDARAYFNDWINRLLDAVDDVAISNACVLVKK